MNKLYVSVLFMDSSVWNCLNERYQIQKKSKNSIKPFFLLGVKEITDEILSTSLNI